MLYDHKTDKLLMIGSFEIMFILQAAYIINGSCKNVMNMSQSDQEDLWTSVMNGTSGRYTDIKKKYINHKSNIILLTAILWIDP